MPHFLANQIFPRREAIAPCFRIAEGTDQFFKAEELICIKCIVAMESRRKAREVHPSCLRKQKTLNETGRCITASRLYTETREGSQAKHGLCISYELSSALLGSRACNVNCAIVRIT